LIFVVEQTSSASNHQQEELIEHPSASTGAPAVKHESTLHKKIDEAANFFTSPFAGIVPAPTVSGSSTASRRCWPCSSMALA